MFYPIPPSIPSLLIYTGGWSSMEWYLQFHPIRQARTGHATWARVWFFGSHYSSRTQSSRAIFWVPSFQGPHRSALKTGTEPVEPCNLGALEPCKLSTGELGNREPEKPGTLERRVRQSWLRQRSSQRSLGNAFGIVTNWPSVSFIF